jgi:DNA-binding GntR family transcriptional regulator
MAEAERGVAGSHDEPDPEGAVHRRLRAAILSLELEPGSQIDESALAERMNTPSKSLREALDALALEGLVEPHEPHGAVVVKPMSMDDLEELYSLRVVGEADAIWQTVPLLDAKACDRLADEIRLMEKYGNAAPGREAHRRFHQGLRVGASERRCRELSQLCDHAQRYLLAAGRRKSSEASVEHRAIVRACFLGERREATDLLLSHCADTAYALIELQEPGRPTPSLDAAVSMSRERLDSLV